MTVHVTIALDEAVKAKLDALADVRQATIDDIVAMAVLDMAVEDEAVPFMSAEEEAAFHAAGSLSLPTASYTLGVDVDRFCAILATTNPDLAARFRTHRAAPAP